MLEDSKSTSTTAAVTSPEEHLADDATVTAGLGRMVTTAGNVATTVAGGTKVSDAGDQLETDWSQVEGTVKANEPDIYLAIEDAITALDTAAPTGYTAATAKASTDLSTASPPTSPSTPDRRLAAVGDSAGIDLRTTRSPRCDQVIVSGRHHPLGEIATTLSEATHHARCFDTERVVPPLRRRGRRTIDHA